MDFPTTVLLFIAVLQWIITAVVQHCLLQIKRMIRANHRSFLDHSDSRVFVGSALADAALRKASARSSAKADPTRRGGDICAVSASLRFSALKTKSTYFRDLPEGSTKTPGRPLNFRNTPRGPPNARSQRINFTSSNALRGT